MPVAGLRVEGSALAFLILARMGQGPFEPANAGGWMGGLRLRARDLAVFAGEAQNPARSAMLIACGASEEVAFT